MGDFFLREHSFHEALDCYRQASSRDPRPYLTLKTARALKEMGDHSRALEELQKVLALKPQSLSFLKEKALILNRMKKFDEALDCYERIQNLQPEDPFVEKEIFRLRSRTRANDQVITELKAVAGMDSKREDPQIRGLLAQKLKDKGLIREAAAEYRAASNLEPNNLYFVKQRGFCHYRLKEYGEALQCLGEAFLKDPTDNAVRTTLKKIFETLGNPKGFLDLLEEAHMRHPASKPLLGMIKKARRRLNPELSKED
jgi:tetratricopeptide (TPR) repeat protein